MFFWMRLSFLFLLTFLATVIFVANLADIVSAFFVFLLFFLLLLNFCLYFFNWKKMFALLSTFSIACFLWIGLTFHQIADISEKEKFLSHFFLEPQVSLQVEILTLSKEKEHDMVYIAQVISLDGKKSPFSLYSKLTLDKNLSLSSGDIISFSARLIPLSGNRRFVISQQQQNIFFQVFPISFQPVSHKDSPFFLSFISHLREVLLVKIHQLFPEKEGSFLAGILIWARENLDSETMQNFNNSGLSHLIAVSGFNITLIILFFTSLFWFLPPIFRVACILWGITFFVFLVGFSPSVVRAACMWFIAYTITLSGRQINVWWLLLLTLFAFVVYNPLSLLYDASLQLSFLAVIGITSFYPVFEKYTWFLPAFFWLKESILMTFSASLTTLPILLLNFWQFSLVAPITNLLVGWTIPFAMFFGFVTVLMSFVSLSFSWILAFISFLFLRYTTFIVDFFGSLSWSTLSWKFSGGEEIFCCIYFLFLLFLFFLIDKKNCRN